MADEPPLQVEMLTFIQERFKDCTVAQIVDHGNRGLLVTLPTGRIISVYMSIPSHAYLARVNRGDVPGG